MSTASKLTKLAQGIDSNGVLSAEKGGTGTTSGGAATVVAATAPESPQVGSFWLNSDTGDLHVYAGGSWILIGSSGGGSSFSGSYNDLTDKPNITAPTPAAVSDQANTSTGYFDIPAGTTAQRPVSAVTGAMRLNTETNYLEIYNGTVWVQLQYAGGMITATYTGATVSTSGNFTILTYASSGTFSVSNAPIGSTLEYLVIGGGGAGGGGYAAGGGGGGGYLSGTINPTTGDGYTITIGAGGSAGSWNGSSSTNGSNTTIAGSLTLTAIGGGRGGGLTPTYNPNTGGSGGGGHETATGAAGTSGQGYSGGNGATAYIAGGGGGGSSAAGSNATTTGGGAGGLGTSSTITGTAVIRAGGGGGGSHSSSYPTGGAGSGGGANGGNYGTTSPVAATVNTGGGGGGASGRAGIDGNAGSNGGSGIVILRYRFQ